MRSLLLLAVALISVPPMLQAEVMPATAAEAMELAYHSSDPEMLGRAAEILEEQIKVEPANEKLKHAQAILLLDRLNDPQRAVPVLREIVEASPRESGWHQALARGYRGTKQPDLAALHFAKAAALAPEDAWVRYEWGNTLSGAGRFAEAVAAYEAALAIDAKSTDTRLALAKTLWAAGKPAEATAAARTVLEYDPLNPAARKLLLAAQAPNSAPVPPPPVAPPTPVPAIPPPKRIHPVEAAVAAAYTSGKREDFARAAELLERSLRTVPRDLPRRKTLAYVYLDKLQSPELAVPHFAKVVELAPDDGAWWSMLAKAQEAAGDANGASISYARAAECAPRDVWSRYHLARLQKRMGRQAEAEATFRKALDIDPKNRYVRQELARCAYDAGRVKEAAEMARELIREEALDAEAHALLGDVERSQYNFAAAGAEYQAALAAEPSHGIALSGIREIDRQQRSEVKLAYYTFDDTDGLRQSGIFSYASIFLTGRLKAAVSFNERFFEQAPFSDVTRSEAGLALDYRVFSKLQIAAGMGFFKADDHTAKFGGNVALYFQPVSFADVWASYRSGEPVNDSYTTANLAFSQSIVAAGLNIRPWKGVVLGATASQARYSDDNIRQSALASASWYVPITTSPVIRMEYEWLNFDRRTSAYSSPDNYARFRPVLELSPRITDWLTVELHGELSYVFDEEEWGTGFTAGLRVNKGDSFDLGVGYMEYEIPGGQTTWSGKGMKVDLSARF